MEEQNNQSTYTPKQSQQDILVSPKGSEKVIAQHLDEERGQLPEALSNNELEAVTGGTGTILMAFDGPGGGGIIKEVAKDAVNGVAGLARSGVHGVARAITTKTGLRK